MKAAFMVMADGTIYNVWVAKSTRPTAFEKGTAYTLGADIDLKPYGTIPAGTEMVVTQHDHTNGYVCLSFSHAIPPLPEWGGVLELMPFGSDDVLHAINAGGGLITTQPTITTRKPRHDVVKPPARRDLKMSLV